LALEYRRESPTFYSVSEKILPKARWVVDVALIINCLGGAIVYVQTAGNLMSFAIIAAFDLGSSPNAMSQRYIAMIVQAVMIMALAPLCMLREISSTKIPNLIGLTCLLYIMICTFFYTPCTMADDKLLVPGDALIALGSFPTFIFAFTCQQNVFTVANELKNANLKRLDMVSMLSTGTGFLVYMPMMILPFLTFGYDIQSNYLYNLDTSGKVDIPIIIAFVFASVSVSISYVLQVQPTRRSLVSLINGSKLPPPGRRESNVRIGLVTVILLTTYGLAVGLGDDLSLPINISGLLGGNTMCFVMPFLLYLSRYGWRRSEWFSNCVLATLVFCIALYPVCLTGIIYEALTKK
jgi:amino acid permease